jgi:HEAT repeat protein
MRAFLLSLLLLLPAGSAVAADDIESLVEGLRDPRRRKVCWIALAERLDPRAIPLLVKALPKLDVPGQHQGVLVISLYPPERARPALLSLAGVRDPHMRVAAGAGLYRLGDKSRVLAMADALLDGEVSPGLRSVMVSRLAEVREPAIRQAMRSLLQAGADGDLVWNVLLTLHGQEDRGARDAASRLLDDERPLVRALAAAFRIRFGREEDGPVAAAALGSGALDKTAWSRVRTFLAASGRLPAEVLDALAALVGRETNRLMIVQAIQLLGEHRYRPASRAIREKVHHRDERVARAAFAALARIPGAMPMKSLRALLHSRSPLVRLEAADALRRHDDAAGLPTAVDVLREGEPAERREAARVLGRFRRSAVVEPLLGALLDPDAAVRSHALAAVRGVLAELFPYRRLNLELTGYSPDGEEEARREGAEAIRAWWDENRADDW